MMGHWRSESGIRRPPSIISKGPKSKDMPLDEEEKTQTHRGEGPGKMEGEQSGTSTSQGTPRPAAGHQELGERPGTGPFPEPSEGT